MHGYFVKVKYYAIIQSDLIDLIYVYVWVKRPGKYLPSFCHDLWEEADAISIWQNSSKQSIGMHI